MAQKGKGPHGIGLRHAGRQVSGEGGIRTLGTVARTPVFETGPFDRSGTSPVRRPGHEGGRLAKVYLSRLGGATRRGKRPATAAPGFGLPANSSSNER